MHRHESRDPLLNTREGLGERVRNRGKGRRREREESGQHNDSITKWNLFIQYLPLISF